jgi:radical SAM superfamily enzyme YgiQ (UPF0313 family)
MVGIPGETVEEGLQTIQINIDIGTDNPWFSVFQPYPSIAIEETVKSEWGVEEVNLDMISENYHTWSIFTKDPVVRQLSNLHKFAYVSVKKPSLLPLVRRLIKLPPNPLYLSLHRAAHMFIYARGARLPVWRGFWDGMKVSFAPRLRSLGMVPLPSWDS